MVLTDSLNLLPRKREGIAGRMTNLRISTVFKEITSFVGDEAFSVMYFGHHCGRNILIVQHEVTLMLVFRNDHSLAVEFTKSVSSNGVGIRGIQIVGNESVILLLDDAGRVWRLINAFEDDSDNGERLHLLDEKCFYEWVPFKKFGLEKVLAVSVWGSGLACLGIRKNSERKLVFLPSADSASSRDCTFDEVRHSHSSSFYLRDVKPTRGGFKSLGERLLLTDRLAGKTYLCSEDGKSLINYSSSCLVSVLHFQQENCLLLCFKSGKLILCLLSTSVSDCVVYLPKEVTLIEQCCCSQSCLLWSDSTQLHHTKLTFNPSQPFIKLTHLKLPSNLESPVSFVRMQTDILVVTINNIYYHVRGGVTPAVRQEGEPEKLLTALCEGSLEVNELNGKIAMVSHFAECKEVMGGGDVGEKAELSLERGQLCVKWKMDVVLRKEFWRVRVVRGGRGEARVRVAELETDVRGGMVTRVETPGGEGGVVRVGLVGVFEGECLFVDLGEVGEAEGVS